MRLASSKFLHKSIILILSIACEDEITTITNSPPDLPNLIKLGLQSNSGENLNSVTISWNGIDGSVIINGDSITTIDYSVTFEDLQPGEFKDKYFELVAVDSTYNDTIQIFTRSVYPVTNFTSITDEKTEKNGYAGFAFLDKREIKRQSK